MSQLFKKICAIHDLSCYGRCALTVIIPTLSRYGMQVVPIPTALLSTHTGGFTDMFFEDFTDRMKKIADHLASVDISFDAIYSGFLGSVDQIETVIDITEKFDNKNNIVLVDPVMGDDGKLYSTYNDELVNGIRRLSEHANILTPNLTEACLLTGIKYPDNVGASVSEIESFSAKLLKRLKDMYHSADIAITGIIAKDKMLTLSCGKDRTPEYHEEEHLPISFPGTGDLFASLLLARFLSGHDFEESVSYAASLTSHAVAISQNTDEPVRNGVLLEKFLYELKI